MFIYEILNTKKIELKKIEWTSIIVPLIPAILGSGFILTSIGSFFYDVYNKPHLQTQISRPVNGVFSVAINNDGKVPATNVTMIIYSPYKITGHGNFSTEDGIKIMPIREDILHIKIPRIIQGGGSLVNTTIKTDIGERINNLTKYGIYLTYDQGSFLTTLNPNEFPTFNELLIKLWLNFISSPIMIFFILIVVIFLFWYYRRLKKKKIRYRKYKESLVEYYKLQNAVNELKNEVEKGELNFEDISHRIYDIRNDTEYLYTRKIIGLAQYDEIQKILSEDLARHIYVNRVIPDISNIIITGENFGNNPGLVFINEKRFNSLYWSDHIIELVNYKNEIKKGSILLIIRSDGEEISFEVKNFFSPNVKLKST